MKTLVPDTLIDLYAEMMLLGCLLRDGEIVLDALTVVGGQDFHSEKHAALLRAIVASHTEHKTIEPVLVRSHLAASTGLSDDAVDALIESCAASTPTAVNWPHFARRVAEVSRLRRCLATCQNVSWSIEHGPTAGSDDIATHLDGLAESLHAAFTPPETVTAGDDMASLMGTFGTVTECVPTGFCDLDSKMNGGFRPGDFIILAARPSMGKSACMLAMALGAARKSFPVGVVSLEMSKESLRDRMLAMESGVDSTKILTLRLSHADAQAVSAARRDLSPLPINVADRGSTLAQVRGIARYFVRRRKIRVLFIDYLQLMSIGGRVESRHVEVASISRAIKELAKDSGITVVALCQLNRQAESRSDNRPRMADLRESGQLEQDADAVLLLHREEYFHKGDEQWAIDNQTKLGVTELLVDKNRNGETGVVKLRWDAATTKFTSYSGRSAPDDELSRSMP